MRGSRFELSWERFFRHRFVKVWCPAVLCAVSIPPAAAPGFAKSSSHGSSDIELATPPVAAASCVAGAGSANTTFVRSSSPASPCAREPRVASPASRHARALSSLWGGRNHIRWVVVHMSLSPPKHRDRRGSPRCRLPPAPTCFSPLRSASQGPDECGQRQQRQGGSLELSTGPRRGARSASVALSWATKGAGVQRLWLWEGRLWNAC